mmetsp:Transcript_81282/g.230281  ORF Transcript_81282/g.230281 Transcript_81282/m.230281 type:complete len:224 (-) Transcript_81282:158-829(-)
MQISCGWLSMVMSVICTSQYPELRLTGTQNRSEARWSGFTLPNVTSDVSVSCSDRNTENIDWCNNCNRFNLSIKLNSEPCDICSNANPRTPSKVNDLKGILLSYVAAMKVPWWQVFPRQMRSCTQRPQISPVPNTIVTSSFLSPEEAPSQRVRSAVADRCCWNCAWARHASLLHSSVGTRRFPLPVSNTTTKVWPGVPISILPKNAVLCTMPAFFPVLVESLT